MGLVVGLVAAATAGCSADRAAPVRSTQTTSALTPLTPWMSCPLTETTEAPPPVLECASITVPMDYAHPGGPTFTVPLIRIPSKSAQPRLLMTNPGGPGVSGIDDLRSEISYYEKFTDRYMVVSFDPRGTSASAPTMNCLGDQQRRAIFNQPSVPVTVEQQKHATELASGIGEACNRQFGDVLRHVGTANVVRDMDAIRAALGFEKMSYLGYSYGTFVGALYADAHPERTERWVLDSVMDPTLNYQQIRQGQAEGMQLSITEFVQDCLPRPDCPLTGPDTHALQTISTVIHDLDAQSQTARDGRELSGARMLALIESSLYEPHSGWPALRQLLTQAIAKDWEPVIDAAYSPYLMVNPADSQYLSVVCIDFQTDRDASAPAKLAPNWAAEDPLSGGNRAWSLQPCETWPVPAVRKPGPVHADGAGPILILNMTEDPATPLQWAQSLHEQLKGSSLVIASGAGHIASDHNGCADEATSAFLLHGVLPDQQVYTCPADK